MWRVAMLLLALAGCKRVTSTRPDDIDSGFTANLDGTWAVSRVATSETPQTPRVCPGYFTQYQPSSLTIANDTLETNGGRPPGNIQFFGTHDLMFSESERWESGEEGVVEYVVIYYQLDQRSQASLTGTANAIAEWPEGDCAYAWNVSAGRL